MTISAAAAVRSRLRLMRGCFVLIEIRKTIASSRFGSSGLLRLDRRRAAYRGRPPILDCADHDYPFVIVKFSTPQLDVTPSLFASPLYTTCHLHVPGRLAMNVLLVVE